MPLFTAHPRYCAACGARNLVTPSSPFGGEVCDAFCWKVLRIRSARSTMGEPYNEEQDRELLVRTVAAARA